MGNNMAKVRKKITRRDLVLAGDALKRLVQSAEDELRERASAALLAFNNRTISADDVRFFAHHQLNFLNTRP